MTLNHIADLWQKIINKTWINLTFSVADEKKSVEPRRLVEMYTKYCQFIGYLVEMCPALLPQVSDVGGIGTVALLKSLSPGSCPEA